MNENHLDRRRFLELCLSLSSVAGCARGAFGWSERQVLPDFAEQQHAHGRVLVAPYALALVENRYLPLPRAELRSLNQPYDDQLEASLELFYSSGVTEAREALRQALPQLQLLHIEAPRWKDYFADPARFRSVSFDGKQRYAVPERDTLQSFDASADYAVVIGSMHFAKSGYVGDESLRCYARFLVWDYAHARAIAEGKVTVAIGIADRVTLQHWALLGGQLVREILLKPPFLNE
jgi:hypothetical protein